MTGGNVISYREYSKKTDMKNRRKKKCQKLRNKSWNYNVWITGIPEIEHRGKECVSEIIAKDFLEQNHWVSTVKGFHQIPSRGKEESFQWYREKNLFYTI